MGKLMYWPAKRMQLHGWANNLMHRKMPPGKYLQLLFKAINHPLIAFSSPWGLFSITLIMDLKGMSQWTSTLFSWTLQPFELVSIQKSFFWIQKLYKSGHPKIKHYKCLLSLFCCKIDAKHFMTDPPWIWAWVLQWIQDDKLALQPTQCVCVCV